MKIKSNLLVIIFAIIFIYGYTAQAEAKPAFAKADCRCKASWDLGDSPSTIDPTLINWGEIKTFTGTFPQREKNQEECQALCKKKAEDDPRFTQAWFCENVIREDQKPFLGRIVAYSAVGTKDYRKALGRDISCPGSSNPTPTVVGFLNPDPILKGNCTARFGLPEVEIKSSNTSLSPRIHKVINEKNWNVVGYGSSSIDRIFLDSFSLRNCKVCYAEMTVQVRANTQATTINSSDAGNDALNILGGPDDNISPDYGISPPLQAFRIWQAPAPPPNLPVVAGTTKTITFQIPADLLTDYIYKSGPNTSLDVLVQDDTRVDSMQLSVWYY